VHGAGRCAWCRHRQIDSATGQDGGTEGIELATKWMDGFMYVPN